MCSALETSSTTTISDAYLRQEQGDRETTGLRGRLLHATPPSDQYLETVITSIRATDVALGLGRLPAGFYAVVHHSGLAWRTDSMRSSVNHDVVDWRGLIPLPSELSAIIRIEVHASFEFQPILGAGEQLQEVTTTVEQLLDCNAKSVPFIFLPQDGDVVSPCSSILVAVEWQKRENNDPSASRVLGPPCSTSESRGLEDATNHGHNHLSRYRKQGQRQDLDLSIKQFECALNVCPLGHLGRAAAQSNLAMTKLILCRVEDTDASLEVSLRLYYSALAARPVGHPDRPLTLIQLAAVHFARLQKRGDDAEEAQAEALLQEAMTLGPVESHEYRAAIFMRQLYGERSVGSLPPDRRSSVVQDTISQLTDEDPLLLSDWLLQNFRRFSDPDDLRLAVVILEELVRSTPIWDDRYHERRAHLGLALFCRFNHLGELRDLEDAISMFRDAVDLTPRGHADMPSYLNNLATFFRIRFERLGELRDLEDAISMLRDAIDLTPHGHPNKPRCLNTLGASLLTRFKRLGDLSDLGEAISRQKDAVDITPDDHPDKPGRLNNLGLSFRTRFEHLGQPSDLASAISTLRDAANLTPEGHPDRSGRLNSLGNSLRIRFECLGGLSDLEEAISTLRDAVNLTPFSHPDRPGRLDNIGVSLFTRFKRLGELSDLEEAISKLRDAVDLGSRGHADEPVHLNNLGISLFSRFERLGDMSDLEGSVSTLRDAVELTPNGHPGKSPRLSNLGASLFTRFKHLGEPSDLEDAISSQRGAVGLTPHDHPNKPAYLNNLGISLAARFELLGELSDLEGAISRQMDGIYLTPHGHPDKPGRLYNLGNSFTMRFECVGELSNLEQAILLYSHAASSPIGPVHVRFLASQNWILWARRLRHRSLLDAYSVAISLLPQLAWTGLSLARRYSELSQGADVVREAAAAALDEGLPETAVEWLEQGRSIVWGELFHLRGAYKELSSAYPDYAKRLHELSTALDQAGVDLEKSLSALSEQVGEAVHHTTESTQQVADKHRSLAIERDKLLQDIRRLPGFEQFLRHKDFSLLRASAHSGPVVVLNAAETRCDALIVLADVDHVIHVPLPNFTFKRSDDLQNVLKGFVRDAREGKRVKRDGTDWKFVLSPLWKCVVKPVLDALAFSSPGDLSRIFWCPTGPFVFLPIHAAGFYDDRYSQPGHKVFDFVVSSYVPTLAILVPPSNPVVVSSHNLRVLAVRQPPSDGLPKLPGVTAELVRIKEIIRNSPLACTTLLESSEGTVEEVLDLMKKADWVHFACHGIQDTASPINSGLCLADERRLKISDIIALSRPRRGLAFLSACQTAKGDEGLSDEAIHIAAGMLFAGYGGVVGTMWSISDRLAPVVARDVYEYLFRSGMRPDYRDAARALHEAMGHIRDRGGASFVEWVPFIHVGL